MKRYKSVKILSNFQNREPNSYNYLGAFYVTCFACVWDFYSRGKRVATWSSRCAL